MWPIGHVAIAYLLYSGSTRLRSMGPPAAGPVIIACFGALFPDLVDKPLAWYLAVIPTGRSLAHSLLVLVPLCLLVYIVLRRRDLGEYGIAFAIGALSHSLVDAFPALWDEGARTSFLLWPYWSVEPYETGPPSVTELLLASLSEPYFLLEFVLLALAVTLWRADSYPGLALLRRRLPASFDRRQPDEAEETQD